MEPAKREEEPAILLHLLDPVVAFLARKSCIPNTQLNQRLHIWDETSKPRKDESMGNTERCVSSSDFVPNPTGPCTQIVDTLVSKFLYIYGLLQ